ncbi:ribose transport system permease protein RbsC [Peptococcaceae bacterium CEB3]|nr:ribose transport system permease protein RbsC [Peptococcaceae bacterium CEB3]
MLKTGRNGKISSMVNRYRIVWLCIITFLVMSIFAPHFFNLYNFTTILETMCLNAVVAIGFTIVIIMGKLDLSIGSNLTLGAMFVIGFEPHFGWTISLLIAVISGGIVGLVNGLLVAKAKIDSFIVTLGTMTIVQGIVYLYANGGALYTKDTGLGGWLQQSFIPLFPPIVLISVIIILVFEGILTFTRYGRGFYILGGNKETAWLAGLKTDQYLIQGFTISGMTAALAGALFAITLNSALPDLGVSSTMQVIAATIIGGASMAGGEGSVVKSMVAVLTLVILYNGLTLLGAGNSIQILFSGLILAVVVLQESFSLYQRNKLRGQRVELLKEFSLKR